MTLVLRSIAYFARDWILIAILLAMIGASVALNLLNAWPMAILVDSVLSPSPKGSWIHHLFLSPFGDNRMAQVVGVAFAGMAIRIASEFVWSVRVLLNTHIRLNGVSRVKNELFLKFQELGLGWHRSRPQGDAIYRLNMDSNGPWGILDTLIGSGAALVTLTAMVFIMMSRSVPLTLIALGITPLLCLANHHFSRTIRTGADHVKRREAELTIASQQAMSTIGLVQAFGQEEAEASKFGASIDRAVRASVGLARQETAYPFVIQAIFALGGAGILSYGGWLVYRDQFVHPTPNGVTCGDLLVFMAYLGQLWDPLGWVLGFTTKIQTHAAGCARVFEVIDEPVPVREAPDPWSLPVAPRSLTLCNVTFSYLPSRPILKEVTVRIDPGEFVAFVGPSGTGKSTLLSLLMRFYDPESGSILLDRFDLREVSLRDARRHIAIVSQDSPLMPDTIAVNLRYGRPTATDDEVRAAARAAGAAEFIDSLPQGYETVLAEGGQNLSGGQRQRLAIARALVSNAPILVLDEPTSALDPEHEQWVLQTIKNIRSTRTIILVTHRIESVSECDQIFVLREGRIAERGTHSKLLSSGGEYAQFLTGNRRLKQVV